MQYGSCFEFVFPIGNVLAFISCVNVHPQVNEANVARTFSEALEEQ
jgi:hypothetical protein